MNTSSRNRYALLIGVDTYADPALEPLKAPRQDVEDLARVLEDPRIGGFEVRTLLNPDLQEAKAAIAALFSGKPREALFLLYFSGHGLIDPDDGRFYLACRETERDDPSVAGLDAAWITRQMDKRGLSRVILILDTCYSGRIAGTKGEQDLDLDTLFDTGRGRVVLTASRAHERAWDGGLLTDAADRPIPHSLFTHYLIVGLESGLGGDHEAPTITVNDLYEYACRRVRETAKSRPQTPSLFARQEGEPLVIARNPYPPLAPAPLPGTLGRYFISYSPADGAEVAEKVHAALEEAGLPVWLDRRDARPGLPLDAQREAALRESRGLLLVMTPAAVAPGGDCEREWRAALSYKKPIILLQEGDTTPPPYLRNRHLLPLDRRRWRDALIRHLHWREGPEGQLQTLRERYGDAERDLRTAGPDRAKRIRREMELLEDQMRRLEAQLEDPDRAARRTEMRIQSGLERERQPRTSPGGRPQTRIVNAPPYTPPDYFQDRTVEIELLGNYLRDPACRLVIVEGRAGVGKTALVLKLLRAVENGRLPILEDGQEIPFPVDGIVYLSQVSGRPVSWPNLHADLCRLLPPEEAEEAEAAYRDPQRPPRDKVQALLAHFARRRVLVMLDNFEDLLEPEGREIADEELEAVLTAFLRAPQHGVTLLMTTRLAPRRLLLTEPGRQRLLALDGGLKSPYAENVLRALDGDGSAGLRAAPDELLDRIREATRGYPRALEAFYAILAADRYTTPEELLSRTAAELPENVVAALVGDAYSRLDPAAQRVMQALAIYGRPVTPAAVDYLLQPYLPGVDSAPILQRLVLMHLARREEGRYTLHPVDRAYALSRIPETADEHSVAQASGLQRDVAQASGLQRDVVQASGLRGQAGGLSHSEDVAQVPDLQPDVAQASGLRGQAGGLSHSEDAAQASGLQRDVAQASGLRGQAGGLSHSEDAAQAPDTTDDIAHLLRELEMLVAQASGLRGQARGLSYTRPALFRRAADYYRRARKPRAEWKSLDDLAPQLAEFDLRCAAGDYDEAADVLTEIDEYLLLWGHARLMARLHERLQGKIRDRKLAAISAGSLGTAYRNLGQVKETIKYSQQALEIAHQIGEQYIECNALTNLGNAYRELGEMRQAIRCFDQAIAIAQKINDRDKEGINIGNLGVLFFYQGDYQKALKYLQQALNIAQETKDQRVEGSRWSNLGHTYLAIGQVSKAIECYKKGLSIHSRINYSRGMVFNLGGMGDAYSALGKFNKALQCYQDALQLVTRIQDQRNTSVLFDAIGYAYYCLGNNNRAVAYYKKGIAIAHDINQRHILSDHLKNLSLALLSLNNLEGALAPARESVRLAGELPAPDMASYAGTTLALIHAARGEYAAALEAAEAACAHDVPTNNGAAHLLRGIAALRLGRVEEARQAFEAAVAAVQALPDYERLYEQLDTLGLAWLGLAATAGDEPSADESRRRAEEAFRTARALTAAPGVVAEVKLKRALLEGRRRPDGPPTA